MSDDRPVQWFDPDGSAVERGQHPHYAIWDHEAIGWDWLQATISGDQPDELRDLKATFDLRWDADMRAIKRWQAAHPGNELVWPDHADMVIWLLEQLDTARQLAEDRSTVIGIVHARLRVAIMRALEQTENPHSPWTAFADKVLEEYGPDG